MKTKNYRVVLLIFLTLVLTLIQSCDFDQVVNKYSDFNSANIDKIFEKGWIPAELAFESMTNIYQKTNLDLNTCVFSFNLSNADIETLKQNILPTKITFEKPRIVNIPSKWSIAVGKLNHYTYTTSDKSDSVYLA
jgi:hypothetical protein